MEPARPRHVAHAVLSLDVGGLERLVVSLVAAARPRGNLVSVVCLERPGRLGPEAEAHGAIVVSLDKPPGRFPAYVERAAAALADLRPDVVHTHQIGAAWYLGPAASQLGIPVVHTEHGNHVAQAGRWWRAAKKRLFFRAAAQHIDRFCCVSDDIAAAVTRWRTVPRAKVVVVANGIPTEVGADLPAPAAVRSGLGIPAAAPVIGTVGRLAEVKQQALLLRTVRGVRELLPDVHLVLVGDGPERPALEALAAELGLGGRVHFLGYQPKPEQFLRIMDVFCLTSRSEGFPVSLLEAWRSGLPVVCTAVGGIPAVVTDRVTGRLVPPGDGPAIAEALTEILRDRDTGGRLGRAGRQAFQERYSLDRMMAEYDRRYDELLADRGRGPSCQRCW